MPKAEVTLPAAVSSVPTARHFVESVLTAWDLRAVSWTATLVVSELAANAALHARGSAFTVRIDSDVPSGVRLEVQDRSPRLPRQRGHSTEATTGRGLQLVESLAEQWGITPRPDGKTVWVILPREGAGRGTDDDLDLDVILGMFGDGGEITADPSGPVAYWLGEAA